MRIRIRDLVNPRSGIEKIGSGIEMIGSGILDLGYTSRIRNTV